MHVGSNCDTEEGRAAGYMINNPCSVLGAASNTYLGT
jgi:hypothetical protein